MRRRPTLALATVAVVALPGLAAHAASKPATKPSCNIVTDEKGDTYVARQDPDHGVADDALDLVSADVVTTNKAMTVVIRLAGLTVPPSSSPVGATYQLTFRTSTSEELYYVLVSTDPSGAPYSDFGTKTNLPAVTSVSTSLGTPTATVDTAKNLVRATFPLSLFGSTSVKPGTKIFPEELTAGRGTRGRGVFADDVVGGKTYTAGKASCIK